MKFIEKIREFVCDYPSYTDKIIEKEQEIYNKDLEITYLKESNKILAEINIKQVDIFSIDLNRMKEGLTELDQFCMAKYQIVKKAYKDKIVINGIKMPCDLREMFTPMSEVVVRFKNKIAKSEDKLVWYNNIMKQVNQVLTWTDDGREDNYYYPSYTLTTKRGDCEDGSFVQGSVEPELGVAFGFWNQKGKPIGHAFSVGLIDNNLVIFDWVKGSSEQYGSSEDYEINFIITKNNIYIVKEGVEFGDILWEG